MELRDKFIALFILINAALSQGERVVAYSVKDVSFSISIDDRIYKTDDQMKILYEVKNRSADSIFIFNPNIYYQTDMKFFDYLSERVSQTNIRYDEKTNEYLFYKLGGHYTYQLGSYMGSMVNMIGIAPKQTFSCNFLLTVLKGQILKHTMNQFWGLEDKIIGSIIFNIGFYDGGKFSEITEQAAGEEKGSRIFKSDSLGFFHFEANVQRLQLGPLIFKQSNE